MEDKIFEMVIESMKQKLIFSDMVEMRKIIKGAVRMMEAHYEAKLPNYEEIITYFNNHSAPLVQTNKVIPAMTRSEFIKAIGWLKSQLTKQT